MTPAARHRHRPLTLLPPGCTPGRLRLGSATRDGAGGTSYQVWSIHLVAGRPCTLWGTPAVTFLAADGRTMPFAETQRWTGHERHGPVLVTRRHPTSFPLAKYRCDTTQPRYAAALRATLPNGAGSLSTRIPRSIGGLPFCPRDDGDQRVHVGSIGSWDRATSGRAAPPVAISLHSSFAPDGLPTWGRADLDGDGHPDTVIVRADGRVTARVAGRMLRVRVPGGPTDRLQGFTDLTGDGRPEVLVGETALGCANGYRLCDSDPSVLTVAGKHLRKVRFPDGEPDFDLGAGDLTTGWTCGAGRLVGTRLLLTGVDAYRLTRTTYVVSGLAAHATGRTVSTGRLSDLDFGRVTATRCRGLTALGWAWERPAVRRPLT